MGPDYREHYTKQENDLLLVRAIAAAIIAGNGIEAPITAKEAFRIVDSVQKLTEARIEERLAEQRKQARGY